MTIYYKYKQIFFGVVLSLVTPHTIMAAPSGKFVEGIVQPGLAAGLPLAPIGRVIGAVMKWTLSIVGFFAIIAFAVAGLMYLTSAGDEAQAEKAKKTAKYALIGVVVALSGVIILTAINAMLKGRSNF